jgi:hypothetical protein
MVLCEGAAWDVSADSIRDGSTFYYGCSFCKQACDIYAPATPVTAMATTDDGASTDVSDPADELETILRQVHIDGYDRGKKQHLTPYTYTLPNEKFLKEKYKALDAHIRRVTLEARRDEVKYRYTNLILDGVDEFRWKQFAEERIEAINRELQEIEGEQK